MTDSLVNNLYSGKFQSSKLVGCGLRFIDLSKQGNGKKKKNLSSVILVLFIYYFSMY